MGERRSWSRRGSAAINGFGDGYGEHVEQSFCREWRCRDQVGPPWRAGRTRLAGNRCPPVTDRGNGLRSSRLARREPKAVGPHPGRRARGYSPGMGRKRDQEVLRA